jgi:hypothetical protein
MASSLFEQQQQQQSPVPSSPHPTDSNTSSPRSALKGSRGSKLDRLRWDEEHLQALEREQAKRKKAKRAGLFLPLLLLLALRTIAVPLTRALRTRVLQCRCFRRSDC